MPTDAFTFELSSEDRFRKQGLLSQSEHDQLVELLHPRNGFTSFDEVAQAFVPRSRRLHYTAQQLADHAELMGYSASHFTQSANNATDEWTPDLDSALIEAFGRHGHDPPALAAALPSFTKGACGARIRLFIQKGIIVKGASTKVFSSKLRNLKFPALFTGITLRNGYLSLYRSSQYAGWSASRFLHEVNKHVLGLDKDQGGVASIINSSLASSAVNTTLTAILLGRYLVERGGLTLSHRHVDPSIRDAQHGKEVGEQHVYFLPPDTPGAPSRLLRLEPCKLEKEVVAFYANTQRQNIISASRRAAGLHLPSDPQHVHPSQRASGNQIMYSYPAASSPPVASAPLYNGHSLPFGSSISTARVQLDLIHNPFETPPTSFTDCPCYLFPALTNIARYASAFAVTPFVTLKRSADHMEQPQEHQAISKRTRGLDDTVDAGQG